MSAFLVRLDAAMERGEDWQTTREQWERPPEEWELFRPVRRRYQASNVEISFQGLTLRGFTERSFVRHGVTGLGKGEVKNLPSTTGSAKKRTI